MNWIKVLFINLLIFFSLLGALLMAPSITYFFKKTFSDIYVNKASIDYRAKLPLYQGFDWAEKHFQEFKALPTTYYDYITWRRDDFEGETINIVDGIRVTTNEITKNEQAPLFYFFGGSTTWGTGVNDENTYPSIFAKLTQYNVKNFGESAYIARQSLAYLVNLIINNSIEDLSNKHIVFYDGVNDTSTLCRTNSIDLGTIREDQIQNIISSSRTSNKFSFNTTFLQLKEFLSEVIKRLRMDDYENFKNEAYNCHSNPDKAKEVAQKLVATWQMTSDLIDGLGGKFTAILQPVAFIGAPDIKYLKLKSKNELALAEQYRAVYPFIKEIAQKTNIDFIDLTHIYDDCDNCYIDHSHVGPQAHEILVMHLIKNLSQ